MFGKAGLGGLMKTGSTNAGKYEKGTSQAG